MTAVRQLSNPLCASSVSFRPWAPNAPSPTPRNPVRPAAIPIHDEKFMATSVWTTGLKTNTSMRVSIRSWLRRMLCLVAASAALRAQDDDPKTNFDVGFASARVFRGIERSTAAAQAAAGIVRGGVKGGIWASRPFADDAPAEVDLNGGYVWKPADRFSLEAGLSYFSFSRASSPGLHHSLEPGVVGSWTSAT